MSIPTASPAPVARASLGQWLLAALVPMVSLFVVRPWTRTTFPVWDYAEILPLLRGTRGFGGAFTAIADWNRLDGRANYLEYAHLAFSWVVAGNDPVGWQWHRAIVMLVAALLIVVVARRVGASPLAAGIAATLFTLAVPATEGWLFIMGEPLAVVFLLLFVLVAAGYTTTPAWRWRAVILAVLAALVMLSKELLGICLPILVLFAVCWEPGVGFRRPSFGPRERWLALLLLVVLALEGWSVLAAVHDAAPRNYVSAFGRESVSVGRWFTLLQSMVLPVRFASAGVGSMLYPANLAFLFLLILGLAQPGNGGTRPRKWGVWVAGLFSLPLIGATTYVFWPRYSAFYGIPFFAGSLGLLVLAAGGVERAHRYGRWIVVVLGAAAIFYSAISAARIVREKRALAELAAGIVTAFPGAGHLDTLFVTAPRQGGRRWPVTGTELAHYAVALEVPASAIPVIRDAPCEDIGARLGRPLGRNGILNDQNPCGRLGSSTMTWIAEVKYLDWLTLTWRSDTLRVELLAPAWKERNALR